MVNPPVAGATGLGEKILRAERQALACVDIGWERVLVPLQLIDATFYGA